MSDAGDTIEVAFSADAGMVFAASDDLCTAYISAGDCMRLTVHGVERQGNRLHLVISGIASNLMSRRKNVRVAMDKMIPISLRGKTLLQAQIYDKSVTGLGILFPHSIGVEWYENVNLKAGDSVECTWQPENDEFNVPAIVRWVQQVKNGHRAGLEMNPDETTLTHLQQLLMLHQRRVITQLHHLGLPPWMAA